MHSVCETDSEGTRRWKDGRLLHRKGAPAIIYPDGSYAYFHKGRLHRDDGPAFCHVRNGHDDIEIYALHGKKMIFEDWLEANTGISESEKLQLKLLRTQHDGLKKDYSDSNGLLLQDITFLEQEQNVRAENDNGEFHRKEKVGQHTVVISMILIAAVCIATFALAI